MTTFPQNLRISFEKGVHVIFGGNHSGKTTIVNSIRYGIFGLSSINFPDMEKRYFVSRIKEHERRSLNLDTVCLINKRRVSTFRKISLSGNAEINAVFPDQNEGFSKSPISISKEKEYFEALKGEIGTTNSEIIDFIASLLFADEDRNVILWNKNLLSFVTQLLTSSEISAELKKLETNLLEAEQRLNKLRQDYTQRENNQAYNERYLAFLQNDLSKFDKSKLEDYGKELENNKVDLENCRKAIAETSETVESELDNTRNLALQLRNGKAKVDKDAEKLENLNKDFLNAFFRSATSDIYHVGNYVYHKEQCPVCSADLSQEISKHLESKKCPLCGKNDLPKTKSMEEIEKLMMALELEKGNIISLNLSIEQNISSSQKNIDSLNKRLSELHAVEANLLLKINNNRSIEEDLHKRDLLIKQSEQLLTIVKIGRQGIDELSQKINEAVLALANIKESQSKARADAYSESVQIVSKVRQRFSNFVDAATNGELKANISADLVPDLNGRPAFSYTLSQFERTLLDYAFRIAFLSTFAEKTGTSPSLILETPDEIADESYIPYLAKAISSFSNNLSIIITTVNTGMMRQLLSCYPRDEKSRHFTDLVSKGTLTQRKYYEPVITDFG